MMVVMVGGVSLKFALLGSMSMTDEESEFNESF